MLTGHRGGRSRRVVYAGLRVIPAIDGRGVVARSYNGQFPGPTLFVQPGETLVVDVENRLGASNGGPSNSLRWPNATSLHVHGLHVSPQEDDVNTPVLDRKEYAYHIPSDHSEGTFWYHPHLHGSSSIQAGGGMAGALIVGKGGFVILLQQTNLAVGKARNYAYASAIAGSSLPVVDDLKKLRRPPLNESFFTVNGQWRPTLNVTGSRYWRIINAASNDVVYLQIPDVCSATLVARDGVDCARRRVSRLLVVPGSRADLRVACRGEGVVASRSDDAFFGKTNVFEGPLFFVQGDFEGPDELVPKRPLSQRLYASLLNVPVTRRFVFAWSQRPRVRRAGVNYTWYGVNGNEYDETSPGRNVTLGQVEEWVIVSPVDAIHPFHIHTNHFQIVAFSATEGPLLDDLRVGDWRDTIPIPINGNVTIRFRPLDFIGTSLAHCHVFVHADLGMMLPYTILNPS